MSTVAIKPWVEVPALHLASRQAKLRLDAMLCAVPR
jgi:hypothetical protein